MSDSTTENAAENAAAAVPEPLFGKADLQEFESEDVSAGRMIGKMLSLLFINTIGAMSIVAYWTSVQN